MCSCWSWSCHPGDRVCGLAVTAPALGGQSLVTTTHESQHHATITSLPALSCGIMWRSDIWGKSPCAGHFTMLAGHRPCLEIQLSPVTWVGDLFYSSLSTLTLSPRLTWFITHSGRYLASQRTITKISVWFPVLQKCITKLLCSFTTR